MKDRFGDNGLIAVVILEKKNDTDLNIDTWVMSCRILSRGMEDFVNKEIISIAKGLNYKRIIGRYVATKKNKLVSDLYKDLGYTLINGNKEAAWWELKIEDDMPSREIYIQQVVGY